MVDILLLLSFGHKHRSGEGGQLCETLDHIMQLLLVPLYCRQHSEKQTQKVFVQESRGKGPRGAKGYMGVLKSGGFEEVALSKVPVENLGCELNERWKQLVIVSRVRIALEYLHTEMKNLEQLFSLKKEIMIIILLSEGLPLIHVFCFFFMQ